MLNETIATMLNETWEAYTDVYAMWEEAELLLQVYLFVHGIKFSDMVQTQLPSRHGQYEYRPRK